jgi:hypothetical protein
MTVQVLAIVDREGSKACLLRFEEFATDAVLGDEESAGAVSESVRTRHDLLLKIREDGIERHGSHPGRELVEHSRPRLSVEEVVSDPAEKHEVLDPVRFAASRVVVRGTAGRIICETVAYRQFGYGSAEAEIDVLRGESEDFR